jgi:hypothetical protein
MSNIDFDEVQPYMAFCSAFKAILDFKGITSYPEGYCEEVKPAPLLYTC